MRSTHTFSVLLAGVALCAAPAMARADGLAATVARAADGGGDDIVNASDRCPDVRGAASEVLSRGRRRGTTARSGPVRAEQRGTTRGAR